jgi:hypothetical protein
MAQVSQGFRVDERLDPYRNRVAILARAGHLVGYLLVLTEVSEPGGVRRSRRQAASQEAASAYVQFRDGSRHVDSRLAGRRLDAELESWARSELQLAGELLDLRWLGPTESAKVARQQFDVLGFDAQGTPVWADRQQDQSPPR